MVSYKDVWMFNTYQSREQIFDIILGLVQQSKLPIIVVKRPVVIKTLNKSPQEFSKCVLKISPIGGGIKLVLVAETKYRDQNLDYCINFFQQVKQQLMGESAPQTTTTVPPPSSEPLAAESPPKTELGKECPNCGASNEPDAAYCYECGTAL